VGLETNLQHVIQGALMLFQKLRTTHKHAHMVFMLSSYLVSMAV